MLLAVVRSRPRSVAALRALGRCGQSTGAGGTGSDDTGAGEPACCSHDDGGHATTADEATTTAMAHHVRELLRNGDADISGFPYGRSRSRKMGRVSFVGSLDHNVVQ